MIDAPSLEWIVPPLQGLALPLEELALHPRNPRQGDVGAIYESLRVFGQQKPIVVQDAPAPPYVVVAGNHALLAARQLRELGSGWTHLAAVRSPMDDQTALRYALADNRTSSLGTYDPDLLSGILSELAVLDLLEATGYDGDDVDQLLSRLSSPESFADVTHSDAEYRCPSCGFGWKGEPR